MHTFGKVCLGLSVAFMLAGVWLTSELYTARAHFVDRKVKAEAKLAQNELDLEKLRFEASDTRHELASTLLSWDRFWDNVDVEDGQQKNTLEIYVGTNQGIRPLEELEDQTKQQVVYCFQPGENGDYRYVGDFRVTNVQNDKAALTPNWEVTAGESETWNTENKWRVRALVPSQFQAVFNGRRNQLTAARELSKSKQADLAKQEELLTAVRKRFDDRIVEIDGPKADVSDPDSRPREDVVGLLSALEEADEKRNAKLFQADHLRRVLLQTLTDFARIQAENLRMVESLPKGAGTQSGGPRVTSR
jgi:hypothetical protein